MLFVLAALVALVGQAAAVDSGAFRLALSSAGLEFGVKEGAKVVIAGLQNLAVPDIPYQKFHCLGKCYVELGEISVDQLACPTISSSLAAPSALSVAIEGCSAVVNAGHWRMKRTTFPGFSCSGHLDLSLSSFTAGVEIEIDETSDHRFQVKLQQASIHLGDDDLHMHGDCDLITDIARHAIEHAIRKAVNDKLASKLDSILSELLAKVHIPGSITVGQVADLSLLLDAEPSASSAQLAIDMVGLFAPIGQNTSSYPGPEPSFATPETAREVQLVISEAMPSSLMWSLYEQKLLVFADAFSVLGVTVNATAEASKAPTFAFAASSDATIALALTAGVIVPAPLDDALTVDVAFALPIAVSIEAQTLKTKVGTVDLSTLDIDVQLKNSTREYNSTALRAIAEGVINTLVVPKIDKILAPGFPLPTYDGIHLDSPALTFAAGYLVIESNFAKDAYAADGAALPGYLATGGLPRTGVQATVIQSK